MNHYHIFREFKGYFAHVPGTVSLILFIICYIGLLTVLFWLCIEFYVQLTRKLSDMGF